MSPGVVQELWVTGCKGRVGSLGAVWSNESGELSLQKFASIHASIHNHFNQDRHFNRRDIFKQTRVAALAEWRKLMA
jgi:hypothetical protein